MQSKFLKHFRSLIGITLFYLWSCNPNTNTCQNRISYENNDINDGINLDSLFHRPDSLVIKKILSGWKNFDYKSDSFHIIKDVSLRGRQLIVLEHLSEGKKHYGAVLFPFEYDAFQKYPLLLYANGLNQSNPSVDIIRSPPLKKLFVGLKDNFIIIPSFRGQSLVLDNDRFCSDGFFGDAFDGATDDALRLLDLVKSEYEKSIDIERIAIYGISRGGTVALLAASRDSSLNCVISQAGPTNFLLKEVYDRYGFQFKYQFLSQRLFMNELSAKILKSSPIYFIENFPNKLLIVHGKNDRVVPIANAEKIVEAMKNKDHLETVFLDEGHVFDYTNQVIDWLKEHN